MPVPPSKKVRAISRSPLPDLLYLHHEILAFRVYCGCAEGNFMKAFALLIPVVLALGTGPLVAQEPGPAFNVPETVNHIQLQRNGGVIVATAANPEDPMNVLAIQTRMAQVAMTGLPELKALGNHVKYTFESNVDGAQLFIRTADPAALNALHDFLRLEIRALDTGDTGLVE
jgi:hypothetical protein